jgi:hypothetical protein
VHEKGAETHTVENGKQMQMIAANISLVSYCSNMKSAVEDENMKER